VYRHNVCQQSGSRDTQSSDCNSDDLQVKIKVKIETVEYHGKAFYVTGKKNVLSTLRETHSVRTMMEKGQLKKIMQQDGE
jgi:hypothetical protein